MKKRDVKKKPVKNNLIYENFLLGLKYMNKIKIYILISVILILITFFIGYFGIVGIFSESLGKNIDNFINNSVQELIIQTDGLSPIDLTIFIMSNNIKTAFFGIVSGIYLAVSPIIIVTFNGFVLGYVAEKAVTSPINTEGIFVLWRLFPHGIFELPAILISVGLGIKLGLYPLFFLEKGKGLLSLIVSFILFLVLTGIILWVISLFVGSEILTSPSQINSSAIFNNPIISLLFYLLTGVSFVISFIIGLKLLSVKDRAIIKELIKNTLRVFIFVVVPLLVVAGIIEGILIYLV